MFTIGRRGAGRQFGTPLHPRNVLRILHDQLGEADLPRARLTISGTASILIAAGVELVEVSMLLGQSELRVTADLYTHLMKQRAARDARRVDAVLAPRTAKN